MGIKYNYGKKDVMNGKFVEVNSKAYIYIEDGENSRIRIPNDEYKSGDKITLAGNIVRYIKKEEIEYAFNCRTYCMFNGIKCWVNSELDDGRVWLMALIDIKNKEEVEKVLKLGFKKDETGDPRDPGTYSGAFNKDDLSEFIYEKKAIPGLPFKEE